MKTVPGSVLEQSAQGSTIGVGKLVGIFFFPATESLTEKGCPQTCVTSGNVAKRCQIGEELK